MAGVNAEKLEEMENVAPKEDFMQRHPVYRERALPAPSHYRETVYDPRLLEWSRTDLRHRRRG